MAGKEVREYTNLSDPKGTHIKLLYRSFDPCSYFCFSEPPFSLLFAIADKKWGKGKDKIDDEDITFQRMVAKVSAILPQPPSFALFLEQ